MAQWPEGSTAFPSRDRCSVCLRTFCVTSAGLVRTHGPQCRRCPGSNRSPEQPEPGSPQPPLSQESGVRLAPPLQAPIPFQQDSFSFKPLAKILKRIPRASRGQAGSKLTLVLNVIVNKNDQVAWRHLLLFCPRCLQVPQRQPRDRHSTLASRVNRQLREEVDPLPPHRPSGPISGVLQTGGGGL